MAAWALADASGATADVVTSLSDALRHDVDPDVRETTAWTLGNLGSEDAAPALIEALGSDTPGLREVAAWALGQLSLPEAPRPLMNALRDKEPRVRRAAAWALYNIEDADAAPELETALARETDKGLRLDYIRALAAMGERSASVLARLLESKDVEVREIAVTALAGGHAGGPWPWPWPRPRPFP
jgi:HEAT repeat protein